MPIVPVVDQNTTGMPTVQAPTAAPMHNYAPQQQEQLGATEQAAGVASMRNNQEIALHIQGQLDDANVKAAESKFIQSATDTLHGDHGYMNLRGADAINGYDPASQALVKSKKDILDSLSNDIQKVQFNRISQQHLVTLGAQMSQHRAQQRVDYTAAQSAARADSMRAMWQNSDIGSPDQNKYIETAVSETKNALAIKGIPPDSEQAQEAERKVRSQAVTDNVSRLAEDEKYAEAGTYLAKEIEAHHVEGDTADRLRRVIRGNLQRTENIQESEKITASWQGSDDLRTTDLEDALSKAGEIQKPEQRQHVEDMVRAKYNELHTIQVQKYRDVYNDVVNELVTNGGNVKKVDAVKWGMLEPKDQADLMPKPAAVQTDLNTWYDFKTKPETLTLDNVNRAFVTGKLSKGDYRGLVDDAVRQSKTKDYVQEAGGINDRINYFASQSGIKVYGTQTDEDKMKHGALTYAVQNEIDRTKAQNHGKVTPEQVDQIIKRELTQQTLQQLRSPFNPMAWFGSKFSTSQKYTFEIPPGATMKVPGSDGQMHWSDGKNDLGVVK